MIKLLKQNRLPIIIALSIAITIWLSMPQISNYGLTLYYKSQLTELYQEIKPLPGVVIIKEESFIRSDGGYRCGIYSTDDQDYLTHYDKEFRRNGWSYISSVVVPEVGVDMGWRSAEYTKGDCIGIIGYDSKVRQVGDKKEFTIYVRVK